MSAAIVISCPCAAESREQVVETALRIKDSASVNKQLTIFRAGIWKPRTSPDTFQGIGSIGLPWLQEARELTGLPIATETATKEQVSEALKAGLDYIWIGARTSANPIAVQAIANQLKTEDTHALKGVMVKNPANEDADLWIGNIQRISNALPKGTNIYAVHRGCNHHPCWQMAYQLRQALPDIPLLLDPSHMSGDALLVPALIRTARYLSYDGIMVEVHGDPVNAKSDQQQQLTPDEWAANADYQPDKADDTGLRWLRQMIDEVDESLWENILKRLQIVKQIGEYKHQHGMEPYQPQRYQQLSDQRQAWAVAKGLDPKAVQSILDVLHSESIKIQQ